MANNDEDEKTDALLKDGARIALECCIAICGSASASAAAKASAAANLLRAAGYMDRKETDQPDISYAEMTPAQPDAAYAKVAASLEQLQRRDADDSIFN
ncbi:hypothetical protein [Phyllobacterium sp. UNC302MFCol5.2]|uniref:hypothetical protein n=1 Tax=Phyllobacterium sp. UNC302MFCol5.2 TaxID=1449065 RepID=UPI000483EE89|nr:hypothetical protein [Phyllobacterium sp. UNC302MFCol5.2]